MTVRKLLAATAALMTFALTSNADAQLVYSNQFALGEANSDVKAMLVWDDDGAGPRPAALFIGGAFANAGGVLAARIARWDGLNWNPLGSGMSGGDVFALAAFDDDGNGPNPERLYAAGSFTSAGGNPADRIARWNGTTWESLPGGGLNSQVNTLCVYNGQLYAGGFFTQANPGGTPISAAALASYNGTAWTSRSLSSTVVNALFVHDDQQGGGPQLYVGGSFSGAPGISGTGRIARFNGTTFTSVGGGISGSVGGGLRVNALAQYHGDLYAGGAFANAGTASAVNCLARWDGTAWTSVGDGIATLDSNGIRSMGTFQPHNGPETLCVSGNFTSVGPAPGTAAARIAAWNGSAWSPLGTGLNLVGASTMAVYPQTGADSALQVGGSFTNPGGYPGSSLGRWDGTRWNTLGKGFKSTSSAAAIRVIKSPHNPALPAVPSTPGRADVSDHASGSARGKPPVTANDLRSVIYLGGTAFTPGAEFNSTSSLITANVIAFNINTITDPDPFIVHVPGNNDGSVLDLEITESDEVICTGNFSQCNSQPAGGMGYWNPLTNAAAPFGLPGIVGLTNTGVAILTLPANETQPDRFRIFTNAFEIGGFDSPWGGTFLPGSGGFPDGSFIFAPADAFPVPTDGPATDVREFTSDDYLRYVQGSGPGPVTLPDGRIVVVGGNYSELRTPGGIRTNVGNAYVNFVSLENNEVFAPGQPPTGPCTAIAWCPRSFYDKTGYIVVAGGPFAIAGYNGTSWTVIGNARNGAGDGLVADIAFMNADNDSEWEMIVGGTITSIQQNGVTVATCRNLLRADATGPGAVTWSKLTDAATGIDGTDNTVWSLQYAITLPPPPLPQALTHTLLAGGLFRSAGGYSAGRFTAIYGPPIAPACFADFNDDGLVGTSDLTTFLVRFGAPVNSGTNLFRLDLNHDGTINTPDLVLFLVRFGQPCN